MTVQTQSELARRHGLTAIEEYTNGQEQVDALAGAVRKVFETLDQVPAGEE